MRSTYPPFPVPTPFPPASPGPQTPLAPPVVYVAPMWEYKHLRRDLAADPPFAEEELNALGADGWELAAVIPAATAIHFYFKRSRE